MHVHNDDLDHDRQLTRSRHEAHGGSPVDGQERSARPNRAPKFRRPPNLYSPVVFRFTFFLFMLFVWSCGPESHQPSTRSILSQNMYADRIDWSAINSSPNSRSVSYIVPSLDAFPVSTIRWSDLRSPVYRCRGWPTLRFTHQWKVRSIIAAKFKPAWRLQYVVN
jgi:hypothetical protein